MLLFAAAKILEPSAVIEIEPPSKISLPQSCQVLPPSTDIFTGFHVGDDPLGSKVANNLLPSSLTPKYAGPLSLDCPGIGETEFQLRPPSTESLVPLNIPLPLVLKEASSAAPSLITSQVAP